jgi:hypothetical protein
MFTQRVSTLKLRVSMAPNFGAISAQVIGEALTHSRFRLRAVLQTSTLELEIGFMFVGSL